MSNYSDINIGVNGGANGGAKRSANTVYHNNTLHAEHYTTMDLCSQAQMSDSADNILNRMDKLRAIAREQQAKRLKSQRRQISFCF
ncbi:MAG: hypothetical protein ACI9LE_000283 [Paraglaciecola sp.]|jgi:hypothetical protein